jgi:toluene monooxygenase electron transfer component
MRQFTFQGPGAAAFLPGQYALLQADGLPGKPGDGAAPRAYSMSNGPNATGLWQFIVRRVPGGAATGWLFERLQPGDTVTLDGPYGLAHLRELQRDIVCVAGGSGLAPMLAIARGAAPLLQAAGRRLHFFYGARTLQDLAAQRLLAGLPGLGQTLLCEEVVSQPEASAGWTGATGWVHDWLDARLGDQLAAHELYFAGPPPMVQAVLDLAMLRRGVPYTQLHWDRFF